MIDAVLLEAHQRTRNETLADKRRRARRREVFAPFVEAVAELRRKGAEYRDWKADRWRKVPVAKSEQLSMPFGRKGLIGPYSGGIQPWVFRATDGGIECLDPHYSDYGRPPFFFKDAKAALLWLMGTGPLLTRTYAPYCSDSAVPCATWRIDGKVYQHGRLRKPYANEKATKQ